MTRPAVKARAAPPARRGVGRPARVTREQILEEAERIPLAELTLPLLAERVGIRTASLYHHFESREALLIALGARCFAGLSLPRPDPANWRGWLRSTAKALYRMCVDNPVVLMVSEWHHYRWLLTIYESALEVLAGAGFSDEEAFHAWNGIYYNVFAQARATLQEGSAVARELTQRVVDPAGPFPRMRRVLTALMAMHGGDKDRIDDAWLNWLASSIPEPHLRSRNP